MSLNKKILIYRLGSLGDTVMVLPCLHQIRAQYPDAEITLLTNKPVAAKAAAMEVILGTDGYFFNDVINYPVGTRSVSVLLSLNKQLKARKFDMLINLTAARSKASTKRDYWFFKAAGIDELIGFPKIEEDFTSHSNADGLYEWEAKKLYRRLAMPSINLNEDKYWDLRLTSAEKKSARLLLGEAIDHPTIAISLGTKVQANEWGNNNWLVLLKSLNVYFPEYKLIIVGAADEVSIADEVSAGWAGDCLNLCGMTSPRVSAAILKYARVFIGHDSGPMHLAASVGTPVVGIFSARNLPGQWFPRGDSNKILYHKVTCAGCGLDTCIINQKKCILSITVNEVSLAVMKLLNATNYKLPDVQQSPKQRPVLVKV